VTEEAAIYDFDMSAFYPKWVRDIEGSRADPNWSGDQIIAPMLLYKYYGDERVLEENYPNAKALVDTFTKRARETPSWASGAYGDWCPPGQDGSFEGCFSEGQLVNAAIYYQTAETVARMASITGRTADAATYTALAKDIQKHFNAQYFHADTHTYESGRQTSLILPLAFKMVPEGQTSAVADALVKLLDGKDRHHLDTGIFGTKYLADVLIDNGYVDAAYDVFNQTTYPSYGDQIKQGATTTWEQWARSGRMESHDHAMFAGPESTFYSRFAGIRPAEPGYKQILIQPAFPKDLASVQCSLETMMGKVVSNWKRDGGITEEIQIPANSTAIVILPGTDLSRVTESDRPVLQAPGVHFKNFQEGSSVFLVESGSYRFKIPASMDAR
jgi:alpha-L-rhamnosidase